MTRDFTFGMYEELLKAGLDAGYEHITVRKYLSAEDLPEKFIIHRHDVDRKPENALGMAKLEASYGISTTYYFRTIEKTFKPELIHEIEDLGHEIGYHYEDMDRVDGNVARAHQSFADELARLRDHATIDTVCMHGNPLTAHDNRDMWENNPNLSEYGLFGEAYISMDFVDVTYFSDTGRTWQDGDLKIKDHTVGQSEKTLQISTTPELQDILQAHAEDRLCVLSHPNRWARTGPEFVKETGKDYAINAVKKFISTI